MHDFHYLTCIVKLKWVCADPKNRFRGLKFFVVVSMGINNGKMKGAIQFLEESVFWDTLLARYAESVGTWALVPRQFWSELFWQAVFGVNSLKYNPI